MLPVWVLVLAGCTVFAANPPVDSILPGGPSPTVIRPGAPGDPVPRVLFLAPMNATWAANRAEEWKRRGVSGFLFQGILDDLAAFPGETAASSAAPPASMLPELSHPPHWEALVREITAARRRLTDGGIESNFLQMTLTPESPWFIDAGEAARARDRFTLAGEFCALTGLAGLALDTVSGGVMHDFRWDAYPPSQTEQDLRAGARRFALRTLRAFIRACPKGDILLLADSLDEAGPLWFSFFEGAVEAVGDVAELRLRLVLRDTAALDSPADLADAADRAHRRLLDRLDNDNRIRWERSGGIVLCLGPVAVRDGSPQLCYPVQRFRLLRDMARLRSGAYVCVNAPDGGWWSVPDDVAGQFGELRQSGAARVRPMPPPPAALESFVFADPFDGAWQAGRIPFQNGEADVLIDKDGAMVVAWNGLKEPFRVETRQALIPVTRLDSDQKDYLMPKDGAVVIPATDAPLLVGGLPLRDYALPAAMWLRTDTPLESGVLRTTARFGLRNPFPTALRGSLRLLPPQSHSVGTALFPLSLLPGERAAFDRTVQGISRPGVTCRFTLAFEAPDLPPLARPFDLPVMPARVWRTETDAPPNGAPATVRDLRSGTTRMFWASPAGEVGCGELRGGLLWKQRLQGRLTQGPVALHTAVGAVSVVGSDRGRIWFLDADGGVRLESSLDGTPVPDALRAHAFAPEESEAVLALLRDGTLARLAQVGTRVWRTDTGLRDGHIGRIAGPRGGFGPLCVAGVRGKTADGTAQWAAAGVDAAGSVLWRTDLPAAAVCGPLSEHTPAAVRFWRVGLDNGTVIELDAAKGGSHRTWKLPGDGPVTALSGPLAPTVEKRAGVAVVAANAAGVHALGAGDGPLWSLPLPQVRCMTASPGGEWVVAGTGHGELVCINADGTLRWRDTRPVGRVCGITTLPIAGGRCAVLHSSADRFVTALDGGPLGPEE